MTSIKQARQSNITGIRLFKFTYNNTTAQLPTLIDVMDSSITVGLLTKKKYKIGYNSGSIKTSDTVYNYFSTTNTYNLGPARVYDNFFFNNLQFYTTGSNRVIYHPNGDFTGEDKGFGGGDVNPWNSLKIDSLYTFNSPMHLGTLDNALNLIYHYDDNLYHSVAFAGPYFEPYSHSKKLPKSLTVVIRNSLDLKLYTKKHKFFNAGFNGQKMTEVYMESREFDPLGVQIFLGNTKITFSYY